MLKLLRNFLNGLAFGITEIIPGVSAGTIAIILGFYFELIHTINHFTEDLKKSLKLAIPLVLGIIAGMILFSSLINFLLTNYSFPTMLFFIGLITGIIPHIFSKVKEPEEPWKLRGILLVLIPFGFLLAISFLRGVSIPNPEEAIRSMSIPFMVFIFFSGILAAAALVIPGVSGSFVLLLLGIYPLAIYSVSSIRLLLLDITNIPLILDICKVLGPLGIGVIIGGLSMVRLIEKLLSNYSPILYSIILGLLSGSVIILFKNPIVYRSGITLGIVLLGIVTFALGSVTSYKLGQKRL